MEHFRNQFNVSGRVSLYNSGSLETCTSGWPWIHRGLPAPVPLVLGSKVCTSTDILFLSFCKVLPCTLLFLVFILPSSNPHPSVTQAVDCCSHEHYLLSASYGRQKGPGISTPLYSIINWKVWTSDFPFLTCKQNQKRPAPMLWSWKKSGRADHLIAGRAMISGVYQFHSWFIFKVFILSPRLLNENSFDSLWVFSLCIMHHSGFVLAARNQYYFATYRLQKWNLNVQFIGALFFPDC